MQAGVCRALSLGVQASVCTNSFISRPTGDVRRLCTWYIGVMSVQDSECPGHVWEYWSVVFATLDGV